MNPLIMKLFEPIASIFRARTQRKAARESAAAKIKQAKVDNNYNLELTDQEWEQVSASGLDKTWKDEYATVSILSILNLIVIGGIASAFGYPQILTGTGIAIKALTTAGVEVGFLLETVVLAALGLSIWRRA